MYNFLLVWALEEFLSSVLGFPPVIRFLVQERSLGEEFGKIEEEVCRCSRVLRLGTGVSDFSFSGD
ncbi:hypothetical protein M758_7G004600 [Ceratodon purpureus]|uniref:Uncharacterized protein n=1 Tax=Ceratodon purpureus TaxID=3225 RepID=A0A8T0H4J3_CERPU|nr:hypothetical protein KC19_7G004800 [Ceratodon purpureus]KAG0609663.1 hypothetical protein M758_7G004600 [Ceratodon purpureus]